ncbi:MAG: NUDIX hydrolase [Anaerolineae bacterium]|nr:NUDIX hydrolase [Anaerolineae bacterium]
MKAERTLNSRLVYEGRLIRLRVDEVALPNGRRTVREVVEARGAVGIVALDDEGGVILVRQYRRPAGRELWEIPAGTLEPGEDPAACARRELAEETGFTAQDVLPLAGFYTSPGFCDEWMHLFLARGLSAGPQAQEDDEAIRVARVPLADALAMIRSGEICDAKTVAGLLLVARPPGQPVP